jgi:hypothetical protein
MAIPNKSSLSKNTEFCRKDHPIYDVNLWVLYATCIRWLQSLKPGNNYFPITSVKQLGWQVNIYK